MSIRSWPRAGLGATLLLLAACADRNPVGSVPTPPVDATQARIRCEVTVSTGEMSCVNQAPSGGPSRQIFGAQDLFVKLASSGTSYDSGTGVLQSNVTVQNLIADSIGTPNGVSVTGVRVFFVSGPTVTSDSGSVTLLNDSVGTFTEAGQSYFVYNQALAPYEITASQNWQFQLSGGAETFAFTVAVDADIQDIEADLFSAVWKGTVSTDWQDSLNWLKKKVPTDTSTVRILAPADTVPNQPVLTANAQALHIRLDAGTTLNLNGFQLQAGGNVDAVGTMSGGTLRMIGTGTVLGGNISALVLTGSTTLQKATKATAAVSVSDGALTIQDQSLNISVP